MTVPVIRGNNSSGVLWHRLQFCRNFFSPSFAGVAEFAVATACCVDGLAVFFGVDDAGTCAEPTKAQHQSIPIAVSACSFIFSLAKPETETGK